MSYNTRGRYYERFEDHEARHPVGSIRYHGDPRRGATHCMVEVLRHTPNGKVWLRRCFAKTEYAIWGSALRVTVEDRRR